MKTIYFVRHAHSSWDNSFYSDFERPLNERGKVDAPLMGKHLKKMNVNPSVIFSSPANRAISTALILSEELGYAHDDIIIDHNLYGATEQYLLQLIKGLPDEAGSVMIIGHNPAITEATNLLANENIFDMAPCGVAEVVNSGDTFKHINRGNCTLQSYNFPKKIKDK